MMKILTKNFPTKQLLICPDYFQYHHKSPLQNCYVVQTNLKHSLLTSETPGVLLPHYFNSH